MPDTRDHIPPPKAHQWDQCTVAQEQRFQHWHRPNHPGRYFVIPSQPPRPPTGEGSVPQPWLNSLTTPTPTQSQGGGELKPSGPAPGGPSEAAPISITLAHDEKQPLLDPLSGSGPRTDEVRVLPRPTPPQPNEGVQAMEEKVRRLGSC